MAPLSAAELETLKDVASAGKLPYLDFARDPPSDTDEQKQKTLSHLRTAIGDSRREVKELSTDEINQVLEAEIQQNRAQAEAEEEADEETEVGSDRPRVRQPVEGSGVLDRQQGEGEGGCGAKEARAGGGRNHNGAPTAGR